MTVKPNPAPVLRISTLRPNEVDLGGRNPMVVCPGCQSWLTVPGERLPVHRSDNRPDERVRRPGAKHRPRCGQSGRPLVLDLSPAAWSTRLREGILDAGQRRASRTVRDPHIPAPTPVFKLAPC